MTKLKELANGNTLFNRNFTDSLRGIAILLVITSHIAGAIGTNLCTPLGGIGVALFLFLSGYGLNESYKAHGLKLFWIKRITKVLLPYFIIETIAAYFKQDFNITTYILDITGIKTAYWYIAFLFKQYIIFYLLTRFLYKQHLLAELNYKRFMYKKLCILLIFSKLKVAKLLIDKYRMHNLYAIFAKLLNICKQIAGNLVNESGNVPRRGVVPKFSDLEVVALNMASEAVGIDSESLLFAKLQEYRVEIPNLISRRQYNDRRKITSSLCNAIRERMVSEMDGGEDYFCIDSKPIEVCRIARSKRCSMGKKDFRKAPGVGYCASQSMYYYGYKLHAVCWLSGIIHSFDLTKASVHDIHYLKDVKVDYSNCTVIGDRGYISAQVQLDLFETANIRLEVPYRCNQKEWKPTFPAFAKARKRIETLFSQLCDQFMIIRNYAKDTDGLFARIIGKISALTILQYINYKNEKPIGRVKYALF